MHSGRDGKTLGACETRRESAPVPRSWARPRSRRRSSPASSRRLPSVAGARCTATRPVEPVLATAAARQLGPPPAPSPGSPLPVPARLPSRWNRVALVDVGHIVIPKIGVNTVVYEGVEQMVIDEGPAHWPGTAWFGGWGNVVLAGHRATRSQPFHRAAELVAGDDIVLWDRSGPYTYRVTGSEVVDDSALWIVEQRPGRTLTLFTCHPIGSAAQRLVISATLMSAPRP